MHSQLACPAAIFCQQAGLPEASVRLDMHSNAAKSIKLTIETQLDCPTTAQDVQHIRSSCGLSGLRLSSGSGTLTVSKRHSGCAHRVQRSLAILMQDIKKFAALYT